MQGYLRFTLPFSAFGLILLFSVPLFSQDRISKKATWQPADAEKISAAFEEWIVDTQVDREIADRVRKWLQENPVDSPEPLDGIVDALSVVDPNVERVREELLKKLQSVGEPPQPLAISSVLENESTAPFVKDHVRLLYGRWLARQKLYDESLAQLDQIEMDKILDPVTLLYHRGLMQHQLLRSDECIQTLSLLLENEDRLPRRYAVLSKMMLADLKQLKKDSLDEISRLMKDAGRRTALHRSGKKVRDQEAEVIQKLDKLIEDLEKQQQQSASAAQAPRGQATTPLNQPQRMTGKGDGKVQSKRQNDGGNWGDLNPTQREAALTEMARDLPPHYRSVIEEYFRKLAQENDKQP